MVFASTFFSFTEIVQAYGYMSDNIWLFVI